jgi:predicted dinucleotide-binding enzyme
MTRWIPTQRIQPICFAPLKTASQLVGVQLTYVPGVPGQERSGVGSVSASLLAAHLHGAKVIKAFNTIWFRQLRLRFLRADGVVEHWRPV